jgi:hypothetical protein
MSDYYLVILDRFFFKLYPFYTYLLVSLNEKHICSMRSKNIKFEIHVVIFDNNYDDLKKTGDEMIRK